MVVENFDMELGLAVAKRRSTVGINWSNTLQKHRKSKYRKNLLYFNRQLLYK